MFRSLSAGPRRQVHLKVEALESRACPAMPGTITASMITVTELADHQVLLAGTVNNPATVTIQFTGAVQGTTLVNADGSFSALFDEAAFGLVYADALDDQGGDTFVGSVELTDNSAAIPPASTPPSITGPGDGETIGRTFYPYGTSTSNITSIILRDNTGRSVAGTITQPDRDGNWSGAVTIPADWPAGGSYTLEVTNAGGSTVVNNLTIGNPPPPPPPPPVEPPAPGPATLPPNIVGPADADEVGRTFYPYGTCNGAITSIVLRDSTGRTVNGTITQTDRDGNWSGTVVIPADWPTGAGNTYTLDVTSAGGTSSINNLTITP